MPGQDHNKIMSISSVSIIVIITVLVVLIPGCKNEYYFYPHQPLENYVALKIMQIAVSAGPRALYCRRTCD